MVLLNQRVYNSGSVYTDGTTIEATSMTVFQAKELRSEGDKTLQGSSSKGLESQATEVRVEVTIDREDKRSLDHKHSRGPYGADI